VGARPAIEQQPSRWPGAVEQVDDGAFVDGGAGDFPGTDQAAAEPVRARRLSDAEGQRLQQIVRRGKGSAMRVRRAMIITASASGTAVAAIARLVAADEDTVRGVIHAFNEKGMAALNPR
jgi:hypothetical protein